MHGYPTTSIVCINTTPKRVAEKHALIYLRNLVDSTGHRLTRSDVMIKILKFSDRPRNEAKCILARVGHTKALIDVSCCPGGCYLVAVCTQSGWLAESPPTGFWSRLGVQLSTKCGTTLEVKQNWLEVLTSETHVSTRN